MKTPPSPGWPASVRRGILCERISCFPSHALLRCGSRRASSFCHSQGRSSHSCSLGKMTASIKRSPLVFPTEHFLCWAGRLGRGAFLAKELPPATSPAAHFGFYPLSLG